MRHYEIILIIDPDESMKEIEDANGKKRKLIESMIERLKAIVTDNNKGIVHRVEDWGRRQLAYMIKKLPKAHYICMNIECGSETIKMLEEDFKFNDAILRHLIVKMTQAETEPSCMMKEVQREESKKALAAAA